MISPHVYDSCWRANHGWMNEILRYQFSWAYKFFSYQEWWIQELGWWRVLGRWSPPIGTGTLGQNSNNPNGTQLAWRSQCSWMVAEWTCHKIGQSLHCRHLARPKTIEEWNMTFPEAHNISNTCMYLLTKKTGLGSLRSHPLVGGKMTQCCDAKNVILW